jgi:hypothetical protein
VTRIWIVAGGVLAAGGVAGAVAVSLAAGARPVSYPDGYRAWHHVKSMVIEAGHPLADPFAGIHHVYANAAAVQGLRSGKYPDGAVIAFDLLEAQAKDHAVSEGARKLLGVMERRQKEAAATGGWAFEAFKGDSRTERLVTDGGQSCFACHAAQKDSGHVYSALRP